MLEIDISKRPICKEALLTDLSKVITLTLSKTAILEIKYNVL